MKAYLKELAPSITAISVSLLLIVWLEPTGLILVLLETEIAFNILMIFETLSNPISR